MNLRNIQIKFPIEFRIQVGHGYDDCGFFSTRPVTEFQFTRATNGFRIAHV